MTNRLVWVHNEPRGIGGAVLGCRQWLASGRVLGNDEDSLQAARLLTVDGLQTYARFDGSFRAVPSRPDLLNLELRAPRTARNREVLIDALSLNAILLRRRGAALRPSAELTTIQPSLVRLVTTRQADPINIGDLPLSQVPWAAPPSQGGVVLPEAGLLPLVAISGPAAAWTYVAVTGIVAALVAYSVSKVADTVDNWKRTTAANDLVLTRQATSYAKLMQVQQAHANAEEQAKRELAYSAAEQALIDSARADLAQGRADAARMVDELVKPPAGGAATTFLVLGLAAVAGLAYTQTRSRG